jgi:hypothetical protein
MLVLAWTNSAMAISTAPPSATGHWKLFVAMDYESIGTVSDDQCYPDSEQTEPTTMTAAARETIRVRTTRPTILETHVAPNGVAVVQEDYLVPAFRARVTATREGDLEAGQPRGCSDNSNLHYKPRYDCGTRKRMTGLSISPIGGIHHWQGFDLEPQELPSFEDCTVADAQDKLPTPFEIVIKDKPSRLLSSKIPRLVYKGHRTFKASATEGSASSSATGSFSYRVTLVKARLD